MEFNMPFQCIIKLFADNVKGLQIHIRRGVAHSHLFSCLTCLFTGEIIQNGWAEINWDLLTRKGNCDCVFFLAVAQRCLPKDVCASTQVKRFFKNLIKTSFMQNVSWDALFYCLHCLYELQNIPAAETHRFTCQLLSQTSAICMTYERNKLDSLSTACYYLVQVEKNHRI